MHCPQPCANGVYDSFLGCFHGNMIFTKNDIIVQNSYLLKNIDIIKSIVLLKLHYINNIYGFQRPSMVFLIIKVANLYKFKMTSMSGIMSGNFPTGLGIARLPNGFNCSTAQLPVNLFHNIKQIKRLTWQTLGR